jgi:hypothetical protein
MPHQLVMALVVTFGVWSSTFNCRNLIREIGFPEIITNTHELHLNNFQNIQCGPDHNPSLTVEKLLGLLHKQMY